MLAELILAILGGLAGGYGAAKTLDRNVRLVGIGVVLLTLALIAAWLIPG